MRLRMLGPLRVRGDAGWVPVPADQPRMVLAVLLAEAGRTVSTERLIDAVWPDRPPRRAVNTMQAYVMRLRRLLGDGLLLTRHRGYELGVGDGDVDAAVFERLVESGRDELVRGRPEPGAARLGRSLALWRGPVFADVPAVPALSARAAHLEQLRLAVEEDRVAALLDLGRHPAVIEELYRLVEESPLRERRWAQLMVALHGCGRRAEALDAFHRVRQVLRAELGLDPGAELRELQRTILAGDASPPVAVRRSRLVPAQLPADVAGFTGRDSQLTQLDTVLPADDDRATAVVIAAISGTAGVGKTALAVRWAHQVRHRFGDGQLYVNLRGHAPGAPVRPIEALARFLRALDVPAERIPSDVDEASALYRSLLADKRVLVLLDNAGEADQVRPLLPGSSGCLALVTSRNQLGGLVARDGATPLILDELTDAEAHTLLARLLGPGRVEAEATALAELATLCGNLPLALRIAAANLGAGRHTSIAGYARRLRRDRLGSLQIGEDGVRAAFDLSYRAQPEDARRLFRLLGLVPGPDVTVAAAAALTGDDHAGPARLLAQLGASHLVDEHAPGRYALHDLLRQYAAEQAAAEECEAGRRAALVRLYEHYQHRAEAAADVLYPEVLRLPGPAAAPPGFADPGEARAWLDAELANLIGAVRQGVANELAGPVCRLAGALRGYLHRRMYLVEWQAVSRAALAAADLAGDPRERAAARLGSGAFEVVSGRYRQALDECRCALRLAAQAGWTDGQTGALNILGIAHAELGQLDDAADCYTRALAIDRATGRIANQAIRLGNLGSVEHQRGRLKAAAGHYAEALALHRQAGSVDGEALFLDQLGVAQHALGRLDAALATLTQAHARFTALGNRAGEAATARTIAAVHCDAGRHREALDLADRALTLARETDNQKVLADALLTRAAVHCGRGETGRAVDDYQAAVDLARGLGHRYLQSEAMTGLADAHRRAGQVGAAADLAGQALDMAREDGYRVLEGRALTVLAAVRLDEGRAELAGDLAGQAVDIHIETGHSLGLRTARAVAEQAGAAR